MARQAVQPWIPRPRRGAPTGTVPQGGLPGADWRRWRRFGSGSTRYSVIRPKTAKPTSADASRSAGRDQPGQAIATSQMTKPTTIIAMRV